jgi:hypothetical protein
MQHTIRPRAVLASVCMILVLAGCGSQAATTGEPAGQHYSGPLAVSRADSKYPSARAAGNIVDCTTFGQGGYAGSGTYSEGATARTPAKALETARGEGGYGGVQIGLVQAKEEADRALYVVEVDGVTTQAVIVHNGPATRGAGGPGWYVESWAHCDYAELPGSFAEETGRLIWTDADGKPVPTLTLESYTGPEHCDWQSMTFLTLDDVTYVRDPQPELADYFEAAYAQHVALPPDVRDTGYEHNGDHLWISADKTKAFVGTADDVELWPREVRPLGCA